MNRTRFGLHAVLGIALALQGAAPAGANDLSGIRAEMASTGITAKAATGTVTNTGGVGLNFRTGPWGTVLRVLAEGSGLDILGKDGDWCKVKVGGTIGYVHSDYVRKGDAPAATAASGSRFVDVSADSSLNVRSGPWGRVLGSLHRGDKVEIVGGSGDWVQIKYQGGTAYVHKDYLSSGRPDGGSNPESNPGSTAGAPGGSALGQRIVAAARNLIGSTRFRTADVDYGNLACAKVVSTALHDAGVMDVVLNVRSIVSTLKSKGWTEVRPPYRDGDVVTWKTYDYTGDGVKDEDTHVGVVTVEGGQAMAINNSSSLRMPRKTTINLAPISRVLRPPA